MGGAYFSTAALLAAAAFCLTALLRPEPSPGLNRAVDASLVAAVIGILAQLIPLPIALTRAVSPALEEYRHAILLAPSSRAFAPLSIAPPESVHALLVVASGALTFWSARAVFERHGLRPFLHVLLWTTVIVAVAAFIQQAQGTSLIYGFWRPYDAGARPAGPFVNRNHLGTWAIMLLPLLLGYALWRLPAAPPGRRLRVMAAVDGRLVLIAGGVVLLSAVLLLTASRSALVGITVGLSYMILAPPYRRGVGAMAVIGLVMIAAGIAAQLTSAEHLAARFEETLQNGAGGRPGIWRQTLTIARRYPIVGTGAGTYGNAMRLYQQSPRTYALNQAHSEYLQVASDGGLLLLAPLVVIVLVLATAVVRLGSADPLFWIRRGAAGGLLAAAVQGIWEIGLHMPANLMLAACLAALIVHARPAR